MNKYSKLSIRTIARFFYQFFKGYFFKKEKLKKRIYIPPFQRFTHECTIFLNSSNERGERGNGQKKTVPILTYQYCHSSKHGKRG